MTLQVPATRTPSPPLAEAVGTIVAASAAAMVKAAPMVLAVVLITMNLSVSVDTSRVSTDRLAAGKLRPTSRSGFAQGRARAKLVVAAAAAMAARHRPSRRPCRCRRCCHFLRCCRSRRCCRSHPCCRRRGRRSSCRGLGVVVGVVVGFAVGFGFGFGAASAWSSSSRVSWRGQSSPARMPPEAAPGCRPRAAHRRRA